MNRDTLGAVAGWCSGDPELTYAAEGPAVEVAGQPPLRIDLFVTDEEVRLSHRVTVRAAGEGALGEARRLVSRRDSLLRGTAEAQGDHLEVEFVYPLYLDGLTRQAFLLATREMAGAADAVAALGTARRDEAAASSPAKRWEPAVLRPGAEAAKPAAGAASPVEDTVEMPTARPQPEVAFAPTHEAPPHGMAAWPHPDPSLPPLPRLPGRVPLRVDEVRGAWARVTGSNGWTGWVDHRHLIPLAETPTLAAIPVIVPPTAALAAPPATRQPTAYVPAGGLTAWAIPDGTAAPVAHLYEGTALRIDEVQDAWARVSAENGWNGWVDGRRLGTHAGALADDRRAPAEGSTREQPERPGRTFNPLLLLAAPLLVAAAFLPDWFDFAFTLEFWDDPEALHLLVLGGAAFVAAFAGGRAAAGVGFLGGSLLLAHLAAFRLRYLWFADFFTETRGGWIVVAAALLLLAGGALGAARKD